MINKATVRVISNNSLNVTSRSNPPIKRVDLTKYVEKTTTIAGIDLENDITKAELQDALVDNQHEFMTDAEKDKVADLKALAYQDTANYNTDITNKPQINNVTLTGNLSLNDLGIEPADATIVKDAEYVHTDNNFTDDDVIKLNSAEQTSNKVTELNANSTNTQYPSAKTVYDKFQDYTDTTALNEKLNKTVQTNSTVSVSGDNLSINKSYININSGSTSTNTENMPLATDSSAGLMSYEDYSQIRSNTTRIAQLEGQNVRLTYTASDNPTELQISTFVAVSGYTDVSQWPTIAVVVKATNHVWRYYNNTQLWQDDGLDTVIQFTNALPGIIQGSATDGKVYAENDGTGSVYGWDALKNRVSDVETNKQDNLTAGTNITITNNIISANIDISGKADKVTNATFGDFAALDSNGNLTDSGKKSSDYYEKSQVYTKTEVDTIASGKQDTLVSGTNIKTINNETVLGSGNIDLSLAVLTGASDPTTSTVGSVNQLYRNTTNNKLFICTTITEDTSTNPSTFSYTWVTAGGLDILKGTSDPTASTAGEVGQFYINTSKCTIWIKFGNFLTSNLWLMLGGYGGASISTSYSYVIGGAVTGNKAISIGKGSTAATSSVSVGYNAQNTGTHSVQLGEGINATANSFQVADDNIYKTDTHTLTVTNAQVNNNPVYGILSGSSAPTSATVGSVGQLYLETSTPALYFCTAVNNGVYTWETQSGGGGDSGLIIEDV